MKYPSNPALAANRQSQADIFIPRLSDLLSSLEDQSPSTDPQPILSFSQRRCRLLPRISIFQRSGKLPRMNYVDRKIASEQKQR